MFVYGYRLSSSLCRDTEFCLRVGEGALVFFFFSVFFPVDVGGGLYGLLRTPSLSLCAAAKVYILVVVWISACDITAGVFGGRYIPIDCLLRDFAFLPGFVFLSKTRLIGMNNQLCISAFSYLLLFFFFVFAVKVHTYSLLSVKVICYGYTPPSASAC